MKANDDDVITITVFDTMKAMPNHRMVLRLRNKIGNFDHAMQRGNSRAPLALILRSTLLSTSARCYRSFGSSVHFVVLRIRSQHPIIVTSTKSSLVISVPFTKLLRTP